MADSWINELISPSGREDGENASLFMVVLGAVISSGESSFIILGFNGIN